MSSRSVKAARFPLSWIPRSGGLFVVKFRGAGQGAKVLVAELIVGMIAQQLGLPVPAWRSST